MAKINSFEEIISWQKAREFNTELYSVITNSKSFHNDIGLKNQITRSSISISSNIAEGFERETTKEFLRFLFIAKASAGECRSQLYLAKDLSYISSKEFEILKTKVNNISKLISGLIKYLKSTL